MEQKDTELERRKGSGREPFRTKRRVKMIPKVGKSGPSTPSPTWKMALYSLNEDVSTDPVYKLLGRDTGVSARQLCAKLWENQIEFQRPPASSRISGSHARRGWDYRYLDLSKERDDLISRESDRLAELPSGSNTYTMGDDIHASNPVDLEFKKREFASKNKTSTELLKVLNKILTLEEQQSSSASLIKALKKKIQHSELQEKDLHSVREFDRQIVANLKDYRNGSKNRTKQHDQSTAWWNGKEIKGKQFRNQSEVVQGKLAAQEVAALRRAYTLASKEAQRERKGRILLENLCDEFAQEILNYEHEVRILRQKAVVDEFGNEKLNQLVVHVSEAWIDGRMQMEQAESRNLLSEKETVSTKLKHDIEAFLLTRYSSGLRSNEHFTNKATLCSRRESFPLHESGSAPPTLIPEESSSDCDSNCFELSRDHQTSEGAQQRQRSKLNQEDDDGIQLGDLEATYKNYYPSLKMSDKRTHKTKFWNNSMSSEGDQIHPNCKIEEDPGGAEASAILPNKWIDNLATTDVRGGLVKDQTLRAMLLQARIEDQKCRNSG